MHGEGRRARRLDDLRHVDGVDVVARAAQADLGRNRRRGTGLRHAFDDRADAIGAFQQVTAAFAATVTCLTGQPKLMSTMLTLNSCASRADRRQRPGSLSQICTASGRASSRTPHKSIGKLAVAFVLGQKASRH